MTDKYQTDNNQYEQQPKYCYRQTHSSLPALHITKYIVIPAKNAGFCLTDHIYRMIRSHLSIGLFFYVQLLTNILQWCVRSINERSIFVQHYDFFIAFQPLINPFLPCICIDIGYEYCICIIGSCRKPHNKVQPFCFYSQPVLPVNITIQNYSLLIIFPVIFLRYRCLILIYGHYRILVICIIQWEKSFITQHPPCSEINKGEAAHVITENSFRAHILVGFFVVTIIWITYVIFQHPFYRIIGRHRNIILP